MGAILRVLNELKNISILKTIYYNFLCRHVKRNHAYIVVFKKATLFFERGAMLEVNNGIFQFGRSHGCRDFSSLRVQKNSKMLVNGNCIIEYGADILLKEDAQLSFGNNSYINCRTMIRCHKSISIGSDGFFASNVEVRDSDGHTLNGVLNTIPVSIGDHVWICSNVEVLKGVDIGDGAMIGAYSLVTRSVPSKALAYGIPARVHRENIKWEKRSSKKTSMSIEELI